MHNPGPHRVSGARAVGRKLRRAWHDRTLGAKVRRSATNVLFVPGVSVIRNAQLPPDDRALELTGFRDHRGTALELQCSDRALGRLIDAFNAAEAAKAASCPAELEVHGVWAEWLELHYGRLRRLLRDQDVAGLRQLLENIHREPMSTGVGGTRDDVSRVPAPLVPAYYRVLWSQYRDLLTTVRPDWHDVASPVVGNPHGAWVDGRLVQLETLENAYYATELLGLLGNGRPRRVLEIGAGMGGQAYQFLHLGRGTIGMYTIVDLPEVACLSAYCLMAALGEDRVRLYAESSPCGDQVVVEVLPHWQIAALPDHSADLVFNAYSFSEMDSASSTFYLRQVERLCDAYFFHVNHETRFRYRRSDGGQSLNLVGSEIVPDTARFRLSSCRPREFVRPENRANVAFAYLYEHLHASD